MLSCAFRNSFVCLVSSNTSIWTISSCQVRQDDHVFFQLSQLGLQMPPSRTSVAKKIGSYTFWGRGKNLGLFQNLFDVFPGFTMFHMRIWISWLVGQKNRCQNESSNFLSKMFKHSRFLSVPPCWSQLSGCAIDTPEGDEAGMPRLTWRSHWIGR